VLAMNKIIVILTQTNTDLYVVKPVLEIRLTKPTNIQQKAKNRSQAVVSNSAATS
jgi:hypothetical protein